MCGFAGGSVRGGNSRPCSPSCLEADDLLSCCGKSSSHPDTSSLPVLRPQTLHLPCQEPSTLLYPLSCSVKPPSTPGLPHQNSPESSGPAVSVCASPAPSPAPCGVAGWHDGPVPCGFLHCVTVCLTLFVYCFLV